MRFTTEAVPHKGGSFAGNFHETFMMSNFMLQEYELFQPRRLNSLEKNVFTDYDLHSNIFSREEFLEGMTCIKTTVSSGFYFIRTTTNERTVSNESKTRYGQ